MLELSSLLIQLSAKDKSALQAQVASLHKENSDLTRAKRILQSKVSILQPDCFVLPPCQDSHGNSYN